MKIATVIESCHVRQQLGAVTDFEGKVTQDSRKVKPGDLFVAVKGTRVDGHDFMDQVAQSGAAVIVCEHLPSELHDPVTYIQVEDSQEALGQIAASFYGNPSSQMKVVGVTGTNGKTTIATLLYEMFLSLGYVAGLISTIRTAYSGKEEAATHTTPDAVRLQALLHEMAVVGTEFVFMEVSSHAAHQKRISGIDFKGAVFTNLSHDHLDYHPDFAHYLNAKKSFFDRLRKDAFALVNLDDKHGRVMLQNTLARSFGYSLNGPADYRGKLMEYHLEGNLMVVNGREVYTRLPGRFNGYNCLAVFAAATLCGIPEDQVLLALSNQKPVEGRFEIIPSPKGITAVVDYAHTPDALENVLSTMQELKKEGSRIISVVGAGGDRDKSKRPVMARVAASLSEMVILTSDNPRSEEPGEIIEDMRRGLDPEMQAKCLSIADRREAIKTACMLAKEGDIILVAGKGHETYQEIKGQRHHFDDREMVRLHLNV